MSDEKVTLGRHLFYDARLAVNNRGSCANCHQQQHAFTDTRRYAIGVTGEIHPRNSMSLVNVAYSVSLTWSEPAIRSLEQQIPIPMFSDNPVELGLDPDGVVFVQRLAEYAYYRRAFATAFPEAKPAITIDNTIKALASFVRSIIAADSPFDRLTYRDDRSAMSASAERGMRLFYSDRLKCGHCHQGQDLASDRVDSTEQTFHNTGLHNLATPGGYPLADPGLFGATGKVEDAGKFKAPSLRNIVMTAPYMHDGSVATLEDVIAHYATAGRAAESAYKSEAITGFQLSTVEHSDLLAFLASLTDTALPGDPRFSDPW